MKSTYHLRIKNRADDSLFAKFLREKNLDASLSIKTIGNDSEQFDYLIELEQEDALELGLMCFGKLFRISEKDPE
jgi:hypothetical protein